MEILFYLLLALLLAGGGYVGWMMLQGYLSGQSPTAAIFGPKPEKRLEVMEQTSLDGRRRLVLIRRDDVEHLIMTGGPVDVVIETGIGDGRARANGEALEQSRSMVYSRPARAFGQRQPAEEQSSS